MKTYSAKPRDISRKWYLLDASSMPLGRVSTIAASLLIGKGKPSVTPHIDGGDFVVIVNADKLKVSGKKTTDKLYWRHSGFPGGLYKRTLGEQAQIDSTKLIQHAVRGMLPVNKLRRDRLARLKVFAGAEHDHAGQNPEIYGGKV